MRLRWQTRHTFWLVLTLIVVAVVVGRRMLPERPVEPIQGEPSATEQTKEEQREITVTDWPALDAFEGPWHVEQVRWLPATQERPGRLALQVVDAEGEPRTVALAAVALPAEAADESDATVQARQSAENWLVNDAGEARQTWMLAVAESSDDEEHPLVYLARPFASSDPEPASDEPYALLNRDLIRAGVASFDEASAQRATTQAVKTLALAVYLEHLQRSW